jgi:hypothetical protein
VSAFVSHTLREVPSSTAMSALGTSAESLGTLVVETMDAVRTQWVELEGAFTLIPAGDTSGAMMTPSESSKGFRDAMDAAKKALADAAGDVFAVLEQTRTELQGTIQNLNERHYSHSLILDQEIATFQADPGNDPVINGRNHPETPAYNNAKANLGVLDQEAERLALDVEMFNRSVDQAEQDLADKLRGIEGGDAIFQSTGKAVSTAQTAWGLTPPGPSQGPSTAPVAVSLGEYLDLAIARAASDRINWFTTAGEQEVADWIGAHPEFFAAIGFIPPAKANEIWDRLRNRSTADASGQWTTGPLATLWDRAPGAIGNLNGLKTGDRVPWSTREVERLLDDPTLTDDQRRKLNLLADQSKRGLRTLSAFIDETGDVRASLVRGDPDTAAQVITVTHGIETDVGTLGEWGRVARDIYEYTNQQVDFRHIDASTAVILQMEWDSGGMLSVWDDELPGNGASRVAAMVEGLRYVNPDAWQEGWAHSLGTTAVTLSSQQSPGVFDHMTLFGSAGLTPEGNAAMEDAIAHGDTTASVTGASADWIAIWGRPPVLSTHSEDPAGSAGVEIFSSNGGVVTDYVTPDLRPVIGLPTGGHNAGASTEWWYRLHRSPGFSFSYAPEDSVGYLDPRGQSFLQAVADFAERVEERQ